MSRWIRRIAAAFVVCGLAGVAPRSAHACGLAVGRVVDPKAVNVSKAEKALADEQVLAAAVEVAKAFPKIRSAKADSGKLEARALRILAVAAVRLDGAVDAGPVMKGATPADRTKNVAWAVAALRDLDANRKNDPAIETDLAEALAKSDATKGEALKILEALAAKDLVASAQGYATLAKLKDAAGDGAARDAAVKKCETMTKVPAVCKVSGAQTNA